MKTTEGNFEMGEPDGYMNYYLNSAKQNGLSIKNHPVWANHDSPFSKMNQHDVELMLAAINLNFRRQTKNGVTIIDLYYLSYPYMELVNWIVKNGRIEQGKGKDLYQFYLQEGWTSYGKIIHLILWEGYMIMTEQIKANWTSNG